MEVQLYYCHLRRSLYRTPSRSVENFLQLRTLAREAAVNGLVQLIFPICWDSRNCRASFTVLADLDKTSSPNSDKRKPQWSNLGSLSEMFNMLRSMWLSFTSETSPSSRYIFSSSTTKMAKTFHFYVLRSVRSAFVNRLEYYRIAVSVSVWFLWKRT